MVSTIEYVKHYTYFNGISNIYPTEPWDSMPFAKNYSKFIYFCNPFILVFGVVPFLKDIFSRMLSMLGSVKMDNMRWVFSTCKFVYY